MSIIVDAMYHDVSSQQTRKPKSKRKRIKKKFSRDKKNWTTVITPKCYRIGETYCMHPAIYNQLKKEMEKRNGML